jgi:hypothetical protein
MKLFRRIFVEKRAFVLPLAAALAINVAVYAFIVYPLAARAAGAADRAASAALALTAAERDQAAARALVTGKSRAEEELATFYQKVLPPDFSSARRMTYARLPALARITNVRYEQGHFEDDARLKGPVGRLHIRMVLQGEYGNIRQFIYQLETAPEFVIIDDVTLAQPDPARPLMLTIELSTYFRRGANGA